MRCREKTSMRLRVLVFTLLLAAAAHAQVAQLDPDWREAEAPPAPAFKLDGLIPLEIPGSALRFGVDPSSVSLGPDGIVRYVVVATSTSGAVNALYEGIRCAKGEFKVYARHNPDGGWKLEKDSPWRSLQDQPVSRHTLLIARTGACMGHSANRSASQIVRDLRAPADTRFQLR
jgi:hypothetical protein